MKFKFHRILAVIGLSFVLFFGTGAGHALVTATTMRNMNQDMGANSCQSACNSLSQPIAIRPTVKIEEQDINPQPIAPYYLAFIGVGWTTVITVAAVFLFKYLGWRPPDLYKLNVVYRF